MYAGPPKIAQVLFLWSYHLRVSSSNWRKYFVVEAHWYIQRYTSAAAAGSLDKDRRKNTFFHQNPPPKRISVLIWAVREEPLWLEVSIPKTYTKGTNTWKTKNKQADNASYILNRHRGRYREIVPLVTPRITSISMFYEKINYFISHVSSV